MSKTTNHSLGSYRDKSAEVLSLGRETRDFFFHFSCSFTAKFILWVFLRSLFLVLYDKSHYVLRLPKKPPQSNESQLNDGFIRVIFLTEKHLSLGILSG